MSTLVCASNTFLANTHHATLYASGRITILRIHWSRFRDRSVLCMCVPEHDIIILITKLHDGEKIEAISKSFWPECSKDLDIVLTEFFKRFCDGMSSLWVQCMTIKYLYFTVVRRWTWTVQYVHPFRTFVFHCMYSDIMFPPESSWFETGMWRPFQIRS